MADTRNSRLLEKTAPWTNMSVPFNMHMIGRHTGHVLQRRFALSPELIFEWASGRRQFYGKAHLVAIDFDGLDHFTRNQVAAEFRLLHRAQCSQDLLLSQS